MSIKAETGFSLKDNLFNSETVALLAESVARSAAALQGKTLAKFSAKKLAQGAEDRFPDLELKQRMRCLVDLLEQQLPSHFPDAVTILHGALPPPLDPTLTDDDFGRFIWGVPGEYVARHGCSKAHVALSLDFLREATMRFSSELAIRPFLGQFPAQTMARIRRWALDDNYHVRRLASEGIRPLLPWASRVTLPFDQIIAVLNQLYRDPARYVVRSVANNLNDLSKSEPELLLQTLRRWRDNPHPDAAEMDWLTRHALRTLIKTNHTGALALLGYPARPQFDLSEPEFSKNVQLGEALHWQATLTSRASQRLKVFLCVQFLKKDGSHKAKMFTLKDLELEPGQSVLLSKRLPFRPMTTRTLYPGAHFVELVVNGATGWRRAFELRV